MMILRPMLVLMLLASLATQAQPLRADPDQSTRMPQVRNWVVKFAPLSLFDPDNTVQFGIERLLGSQHAVQAEFGYGWQGMNLWQNSQNHRYSHREVWRGRLEYRYYVNRASAPVGQYVAVEGFYKQVNALESGTVGIGCQTGPCQYYQLFASPVSKYVWGGHVKFGRQFSVLPSNRLLVDVYTGLGFRQRQVGRFGQPNGVYYYESAGYNLFDAFSPQTYAIMSVAYGLKVGYLF